MAEQVPQQQPTAPSGEFKEFKRKNGSTARIAVKPKPPKPAAAVKASPAPPAAESSPAEESSGARPLLIGLAVGGCIGLGVVVAVVVVKRRGQVQQRAA